MSGKVWPIRCSLGCKDGGTAGTLPRTGCPGFGVVIIFFVVFIIFRISIIVPTGTAAARWRGVVVIIIAVIPTRTAARGVIVLIVVTGVGVVIITTGTAATRRCGVAIIFRITIIGTGRGVIFLIIILSAASTAAC
ncbi:hypothetical protein AA19596_1311 [Acetobacter fabarum DSM 19596]|nr:hypothetical protein AA19596_1311 [Acetobacter fabarum DSM 19596]